MLVFTALSVSLAVVGYDLIHLAQRWIAYLLIGALLIFVGRRAGEDARSRSRSRLPRFSRGAVLAQFLRRRARIKSPGRSMFSDYSRYLPRNVGVGASSGGPTSARSSAGLGMMLVGTLAGALISDFGSRGGALRAVADAVFPGFGRRVLFCSLLGLVTITSLTTTVHL